MAKEKRGRKEDLREIEEGVVLDFKEYDDRVVYVVMKEGLVFKVVKEKKGGGGEGEGESK